MWKTSLTKHEKVGWNRYFVKKLSTQKQSAYKSVKSYVFVWIKLVKKFLNFSLLTRTRLNCYKKFHKKIKTIAYFRLSVYTIINRWAICLSCGLTHKIRNSFRTSGAGQLAGNGKTSIAYRTSGADQLADNRKISH